MRMSNLRQPGSSSGFSKYFCTTHGGDERGWGREKRGEGWAGLERGSAISAHQAAKELHNGVPPVHDDNLLPFAAVAGLEDPHALPASRKVTAAIIFAPCAPQHAPGGLTGAKRLCKGDHLRPAVVSTT